MSSGEPASKKWWEQERAKGKARFILLEGVLRQGLPFAIFMTLFWTLFLLLNDSVITHRPVTFTWAVMIEFTFSMVAFGGYMGMSAWRNLEREFQKPTDNEDVV